ncbi:glycosyltransferase [Actinopolymorpha sp. B17G11]|uniref:glycosyltransferase n=1 Tax=Actinopolymorpha sp. B17G11 TaxID=3160861 RepID=UPI0032E393DC
MRPAWGSFVASRVEALRRLGHQVDLVAVRDHPSSVRRYASLLTAVLREMRGPRRAPGRPRRAVERRRARGPWRTQVAQPGEGVVETVVEAHIAYPTGLFAWPLAARLGVPLVLFAHGSDVLRLPGRSGLDRALCRAVFRRAALVVANSTYLAGEVEARLGVDPERIVCVSPGIRYADLAAAAASQGSANTVPAAGLATRTPAAGPATPAPVLAAAAAGRQGDGRRPHELLFVANLIHRKGLDILLDALAELTKRGDDVPALRVVGDGPERPALTQRAQQAGLPVYFAGELPHDAVIAEMASADLLVVPSREEALGLAPLEAMAAGCVPVVAAVGGLTESVTDGVTGFTCPPEDPGALATTLVKAVAAVRDPARRAALREAGDTLARRHDVDAAAVRTIEHYAGLGRTARRSSVRPC